MKLFGGLLILCMSLAVGTGTEETIQDNAAHPSAVPEEASFSDWGIGTIRDGFETVNAYLDYVSELLGGKNGVCQYRCRYGKAPMARPDYKSPEPNGCSSYFLGLKLDMGIPAMTKCCNQLDICYDTCGANKYRCDAKFRWCLQSICSDLKRSLGFVSKVAACESVADAVFKTVRTLGCRPFMDSQRSACICQEEEREEL
ncbi:XIIB secretory phospholipase A2 isoform X2 [Podarcis lilfordi]|uniref:Group XIIB secretory phospholipase A2-like protein n=1 Tax=Podarcis lilfordi TaxID=74358 RepID=A0AA35P4G7_9SAUR|nr:group XIIB secretory phospholipase A2-like protein isoform X2 [Podarcis muralis]CAI5774624.1 XIIB secretory phospholipase A2 isoform X2 [Podarcis lilfordi]